MARWKNHSKGAGYRLQLKMRRMETCIGKLLNHMDGLRIMGVCVLCDEQDGHRAGCEILRLRDRLKPLQGTYHRGAARRYLGEFANAG